ncbi:MULTISPECIES: helix-turn-helix domain-containing protein [Methylobacterium]|jgi:transcriptional regulator with XRE-family HTH domain|uniref:HTH-type transcriptional regulator/antitoxin HipB n=2 Tax=Methylobacterium TaxID=407 RepID=A0AAJ1TKJ7_9HYPH|nr:MULTISPECIES: helix-turn-helix transcriptional regulator [Methylobacterium]MBN6820795.1 helix-turn-helix transcriptional regulator [Methylobacterium organophilum]MBP29230.1 XRE family transcriptional regulator [Methylobacterium sp.]MCB4802314.1 helix-turn-helix domain-containing protein [Methylobacterium brachiatum]MDH2310636.1 helix-turn-helix transcriptional regulator [Methylobacterium brachiatum]MDQ0542660.1 HTH-type transcriptional regulator/antitoxin HipB [Methylobacterium brachiatum]
MPKTLRSARHRRLIELLVEARERSGLTQSELASRLGRYQSVVAAIEGGGRRIDLVEFLEIADALEIDATVVLKAVRAISP